MNVNRHGIWCKECWLTLFVIIFSTSSLVVIIRISMELFFMLLGVVIFLVFVWYGKKKVSVKQLQLVLLLSLIVFCSICIHQDFSMVNFAFLILPWFGMAFFWIIDRDKFAYYYCNCMLFLAIYSLVAHYVLLFVLPNLVELFPIGRNSGGFPVHDFFFSFRYVSSISRNTGLFREMGVYAVYLNIALYLLFFEIKDVKHRQIKIVILFITILSTLSTPGILGMVLIGMAGMMKMLNSGNIREIRSLAGMIGAIMMAAVIVFIFVPYSRHYVGQAMIKLTQGGSSFQGRIGVMQANLKAWCMQPFLGNAYEGSVRLATEYYGYSGIMHNTGSNTSLLSMYGVFYVIILYMNPVINLIRNRNSRIAKMIGMAALFMLLECQYVILDSLFWIFVFYFINGNRQECQVEGNGV